MVFHPPAWVPPLPDLPDSITVEQFLTDERFGCRAHASARDPYTCGLTGATFSAARVAERVQHLARALARRLDILPADGDSAGNGTPWHRVVALYAYNTIDYVPLTLAIHRCDGIATTANVLYSAHELTQQLRSSGAIALFTCQPLLENALTAAEAVAIPRDRIFLLPEASSAAREPAAAAFPTVDDLISEGANLPALPPLRWPPGQGARQPAYLCYSSGTSGMPKGVMISHRNAICNILQNSTFEKPRHAQLRIDTQTVLGALPLSHLYGLFLISFVAHYRGDQVIILPRYDFAAVLAAIQRFRIAQLSIVPPILVQLISNRQLCARYDLSSVRFVFCGAAPLGFEVIDRLHAMFPRWRIGQGYGMTEASPCVTSSSELDLFPGSSGSLLPGIALKIIDANGKEVTQYGIPGELYIQAPSVTLGYLNNEKASAETYVWHNDGRWLRTGDEGLIRKSPQGNEHLFITDRIKELIKVKSLQVAPAELEAHLLSEPLVSDCAVIPTPDDYAGEVPRAYVVLAPHARDHQAATAIIHRHVEKHKAPHKWLKGGVVFVDAIPKSPSGKILRRLLRERDAKDRARQGAKL